MNKQYTCSPTNVGDTCALFFLLLFQSITNLREQFHLSRGFSGLGRSLFLLLSREFHEASHHEEHAECHNEEVEARLKEATISNAHGFAALIQRVNRHVILEILEIDATNQIRRASCRDRVCQYV